jgi:hypothetical protein
VFDVIQSLFSNLSSYQLLLLYLFLLVALFFLFPIELFHDFRRVLHAFPVFITQYFLISSSIIRKPIPVQSSLSLSYSSYTDILNHILCIRISRYIHVEYYPISKESYIVNLERMKRTF